MTSKESHEEKFKKIRAAAEAARTKDGADATIAPAVPMDRLMSKARMRKLLGLTQVSLDTIIEQYKIPAAKVPEQRFPKYRLGDVLHALGVGISSDVRLDRFNKEAELDQKKTDKDADSHIGIF